MTAGTGAAEPEVDLGFRDVLFVDDHRIVGAAFMRTARQRWGKRVNVRAVTSRAAALEVLRTWHVDLVILDIRLGSERGTAVLPDLLAGHPRPLAIATSVRASREDVGNMVVAGACGFVEKTLDVAMLVEIERLARRPVDLTATATGWTGRVTLHEAETAVRQAMTAEALARAGGSRRGAARLLGVSREALQYILRGPSRSADVEAPELDGVEEPERTDDV